MVLLNIKPGTNETLRKFMNRFSLAMRSVNRLFDEVAILALQPGLKESNFLASITRDPTYTLDEVTKRAYREMDIEEMLEGNFKEARTKNNGGLKVNNAPKAYPDQEGRHPTRKEAPLISKITCHLETKRRCFLTLEIEEDCLQQDQ